VDQLDSTGHRHSPAALGTPDELRVDVELAAEDGRDAIAPADTLYPKDALRAATVARARVWLDSVAAKPVHGLQLTPYGQLAVMGEQDALAQKELAQRLATPGLSVEDRAFALSAGAIAFADREHPQWLSVAERYLAQLVALGVPGDAWQFAARDQLSAVYYELGRRPEALAHALGAYALLPDLPFEEHILGMNGGLYLRVADILLGTPGMADGRSRMHAVDSLIVAMAHPAPDRIQLDSGTLWPGQRMIRMVQADSAFVFSIGQPGAPVRGTTWINGTDAGPHDQRVDDGRVYLLDFFPLGAPSILAGQLSLERLQRRLGPAVQVIGITSASGHWGEQFVDPDVEIQRWQHFFAQDLRLSFPVAIWARPKEQTLQGGMLPPQNPTLAAYHMPGGFGVVVVDARGRVRRFFTAGRDQEDDIAQFVTQIEAEGTGTAPRSAR
jgi:hypothetical protein